SMTRRDRIQSAAALPTTPGLRAWGDISAKVKNPRDHSIEWKSPAQEGFPHQFGRDRTICLDRNGGFSRGYSGWRQTADGHIAMAGYTRANPPSPMPFVRACVATEKDLL